MIHGRRNFRFWTPNASRGFCVVIFFYPFVGCPSPPLTTFGFSLLSKVRIPRKVKLYVWKILHGRVTLWTVFNDIPFWCCSRSGVFFVGVRKRISISQYGVVNLLSLCGRGVCSHLGIVLT